MNILHICAYDETGGAARSAYRLHRGLLELGVQSRMLVQNKSSDDHTVVGPENRFRKFLGLARPVADRKLAEVVAGATGGEFYPALLPFSGTVRRANAMTPEIVHLHWVCGGLLRVEDLSRFTSPVVWTLHDMWPFTGGCNYAGTCERYRNACGDCPKLRRHHSNDLSARTLQRKKKHLGRLNLTVVSPSDWLANCARQSTLMGGLEIQTIPYGLDLSVFKPQSAALARTAWNLPPDVPIILFGAVMASEDKRKGFDLLQKAIKSLRLSGVTVAHLVVFGAGEPETPVDPGFSIQYVGRVRDEVSLSLLYSAADVTVIPSREDNLPNVALESLACGTPVVAFQVGGLPEIVDDGINGVLADVEDHQALAEGIRRILEARSGSFAFREKARAKALETYDLRQNAAKYVALYQRLLLNARHPSRH